MKVPELAATQAVAIDAYTGDAAATGRFAADHRAWALATPKYGQPFMRPDPPDPENWADPRVGWGLILPESAGRTDDQLAGAGDAPEAIQALVAARHGKVLRYRAGTKFANWTLRDYAGGGDLLTAASPVGAGPQQVPKYLLIYATPADVPWHVQFALNPVRCVGRLDLTGDALDNYVTALMDGWKASAAAYSRPVVWAVDHGDGDITTLMRDSVAAPIAAALACDNEVTHPTFIDGSSQAATTAALRAALAANQPALVVTSSHGMTGPLADVAAMKGNLGLLVDQAHHVMSPDDLLAHWQPDGAIWFAQACCSAGADSPSAYAGLFEPGSVLDETLTAIAKVGATTSPLPRALLGAARPLRAFIGHVEPTFDWTLSFPPNRQVLTSDLETAIYTRLCGGQRVGRAMRGYYPAIGSLLQGYVSARTTYGTQVGAAARQTLDMLVYSRVSSHDRASTVILGDPTAAIPLPSRPNGLAALDSRAAMRAGQHAEEVVSDVDRGAGDRGQVERVARPGVHRGPAAEHYLRVEDAVAQARDPHRPDGGPRRRDQ
jgi:hypothetical protein